jgi:hypothetical protein
MKVGLIAMSGVRAHNPELTELGLTLPGFVERNKVIASLPSLGLLTLAGMAPDDCEFDYLEIADLKDQPELPLGYDLIAISSFSAQVFEAYAVADFWRTSTRAITFPWSWGDCTYPLCRKRRCGTARAWLWGRGN